ncbi:MULTISPECIES: helix-turn-helix transcriptional regulator [Rhodococcus]|uniref:HTH luxR-type domain-containing protein n=1 Tax=Rhodococcus qingshengii TaxID=334542 RepID=A0A2A5IZW9_RHOSG|nr:sigma factor-like helix-turn-helix DNA-binding protein [Rhodococcus qingshengii]PCK22662.1 hypothetical protein CHR55_31835 [Rhodococcus qingshengii]
MRTTHTTRALDVTVISPPSVLGEAITALVRSLGYRAAISELAAPRLPTEILLFVSSADLLRYKHTAGQHGPKVVSALAEPQHCPGTSAEAIAVDLRSSREELATALRTLLPRPAPATTRLSPTEKRIVAGYVSGLTQPELARRFFLAPTTVATHLTRARRKYRDDGRLAGTKIELFMRAVEDAVIGCPCATRKPHYTDPAHRPTDPSPNHPEVRQDPHRSTRTPQQPKL